VVVVSPAAGLRSPGVLAIKVDVTIHMPGGHEEPFSQILQVLLPAHAAGEDISLHVAVPLLDTVPALTGSIGQQNNVGIGYGFDLTAQSTLTGQPLHQLASKHPLVMQLTYNQADLQGLDPTTLRIAFFDPTTGTWSALPTTVDSFHHTLTATVAHVTLFQVRATARTQAQINATRVRLATLAAAGPPRVSVLPIPQTTLAGVPLLITLPSGRQHPPFSIQVTGVPRGQLTVTYTVAGNTTVQTLSLDAHGYATTAFVPSGPQKAAQRLRVSVTVVSGASHLTRTETVMLLPGLAAGPRAPGAPSLRAVLSVTRVRAGMPGPLLTVQTTHGATVHVALMLPGHAPTILAAVAGKANSRGALRLRLPKVARALVVSRTTGTRRVLALQVVVTSTVGDQSTRQVFALTIAR
jgi:hypothetical protein